MFGKYIAKYLLSFAGIFLLLAVLNILAFGWMFSSSMAQDYGDAAPKTMLEQAASASSPKGISPEMTDALRRESIWALFLDPAGQRLWSVDVPQEIPSQFTVQDVAVFSRGYLEDYPVFVRSTAEGLMVLGYPKGSYTKILPNFYPIHTIRTMLVFAAAMLTADLLLLFTAYTLSKQGILRQTAPIGEAIGSLADGRPVSLEIRGELSGIADRLNRVSRRIGRQNEARANWIRGVSHDIRTPLSMILGYAGRIASDEKADGQVREEARIIEKQGVRIKELIQDLNAVSQLEYEMQPLHKKPVRLAKLLRETAARLLNDGLSGAYPLEVEIDPQAEQGFLPCDERLVSRAVANLVHNSVQHNPQGCSIRLALSAAPGRLTLSVTDDGVGFSQDQLNQKPHYMESNENRLDLRHGLGLLLVRQIAQAHGGTMEIDSTPQAGCRIDLKFPEI